MEKIAALVEGHTEVHFVKSSYANSIVQRPFPNGKCVSIDLIIDSIVDALETIGGDIRRVIILLDREDREISAQDMAQAIVSGVGNAAANRKLYVGVTDRQIENWILADETHIRDTFKNSDYVYAGDGSKGKGILDSICGNALKGPVDRARMLKACSALRSGQKSESLERFRSSIDFDWYWATN